MPGSGARGQNLVYLQNVVFLCQKFPRSPYLDNHLSVAFILGPKVPYRVGFHSIILDLRVYAGGWVRGKKNSTSLKY